jgi:hypothetical protein
VRIGLHSIDSPGGSETFARKNVTTASLQAGDFHTLRRRAPRPSKTPGVINPLKRDT